MAAMNPMENLSEPPRSEFKSTSWVFKNIIGDENGKKKKNQKPKNQNNQTKKKWKKGIKTNEF